MKKLEKKKNLIITNADKGEAIVDPNGKTNSFIYKRYKSFH